MISTLFVSNSACKAAATHIGRCSYVQAVSNLGGSVRRESGARRVHKSGVLGFVVVVVVVVDVVVVVLLLLLLLLFALGRAPLVCRSSPRRAEQRGSSSGATHRGRRERHDYAIT